MKFRYVGDKADMRVFGYDFSDGQTPDVTDEHAIKKLSGNSHFEEIEDTNRPSKVEMLALIQEAQTVEELERLADGEDRKAALEAIEKRKAELADKLPLE
jgi:hypothetical protein